LIEAALLLFELVFVIILLRAVKQACKAPKNANLGLFAYQEDLSKPAANDVKPQGKHNA